MQILDVGGCPFPKDYLLDGRFLEGTVFFIIQFSKTLFMRALLPIHTANIWFVNATNYWDSTTIHA